MSPFETGPLVNAHAWPPTDGHLYLARSEASPVLYSMFIAGPASRGWCAYGRFVPHQRSTPSVTMEMVAEGVCVHGAVLLNKKEGPAMKPIRWVPVLLVLWISLLVCLPASVSAACAPQPANLISWWKGDGNARDKTGLNNGALMNGTGFASGMVGQAFSFDGVDDYVSVPNSASLDPTAAASIVVWVYFDQLPSAAGHFMYIAGKSGSATDLDVQAQTDNRVYFYVDGSRAVASTTVVQTGRWYHIVGTYTASNQLKMYVNGVLENTVSIVGTTRGMNNNPFTIGQSAIWGGRFFKGRIDEVGLFNRALSDAEVQSIYNAGGAGICATPDLFWQHATTGDVYVWTMNGTTPTSGTYIARGMTPWRVVATGDFCGADGNADIVWQHGTTGDVYLWCMNGTTISSATYLAQNMGPWKVVAAVDLNGDGKPDLLWQHATSGDVYVWFMNGTVPLSGAYLAQNMGAWKVVGTADLSGHGYPDLLWQHATSGDVYVWFMNGTAQTGGAYLAQGMGSWKIVGAADLNTDGKPDLLWQDAITSDVYIWFMNGTTLTGGAYLAQGMAWWQVVGPK
jgi:hypothetical protein